VGRAFGVSYVCFAVRHHRAGIAIMPIEFNCTQCGKQLRTPDETAGRNAKCPQCGAIMQIPNFSGPAPQQPPAFGPSPGQQPGASPFGLPPAQPADQGGWNPYASPNIGGESATFGPSAAAAGIVPTRVEFGRVIDVSWQIYKTKVGFGALFALVLLVMGIVAYAAIVALGVGAAMAGKIPGMPGQVAQPQIGLETYAFLFVFQVIAMAVGTWLDLGIWRCFIKVARGGPGELGDLFSGGKWLGRGLVIQVIFFVVGIVCGLPGIFSDNPAIIWTGTIIGWIAHIVLMLMFGLAPALVVDKDMTVGTALSTSMEIMRGNKLIGFLLVLVVSIAAWIFIAVTCLIGAFFAIPLLYLMRAVFYMHAAGQPTMLDQPAGSYQ
jgi:hypothetical protein